MTELPLENTSFYDLPKINPTNNDVPSDGPVRDIPGREIRTRDGMVAMKQQIPGGPRMSPTPENDPRSWNSGGDGTWWSVQNSKIIDESKKPINSGTN